MWLWMVRSRLFFEVEYSQRRRVPKREEFGTMMDRVILWDVATANSSTIRTTTEKEVRIVAMKNPVHPGEILREDVLADLGLGVGEAASRLGISRVALSRVLHGHARISPNLAVRLEAAGVGTARAWLAMQTAHDLAAERASGSPKVRPLSDVA